MFQDAKSKDLLRLLGVATAVLVVPAILMMVGMFVYDQLSGGPGRRETAERFAPLLSEAGSRPTASPETGSACIKGKVVLAELGRSAVDDLHFELAESLRATDPEQVGAIAWLSCRPRATGRFFTWRKTKRGTEQASGTTQLHAAVCDVAIVQTSARTTIDRKTLERLDEVPPQEASIPEHLTREHRSARPDKAIRQYVESAYRKHKCAS